MTMHRKEPLQKCSCWSVVLLSGSRIVRPAATPVRTLSLRLTLAGNAGACGRGVDSDTGRLTLCIDHVCDRQSQTESISMNRQAYITASLFL